MTPITPNRINGILTVPASNEKLLRQRSTQRRWYARNRAKIVARQRAARAADPERFREYDRRQYQREPEKFRARVRAWKLKQKDGGQQFPLPFEATSAAPLCTPPSSAATAAASATGINSPYHCNRRPTAPPRRGNDPSCADAFNLLCSEMNSTHLSEFASEHCVSTVRAGCGHFADGEMVESVEFDYDAIDEALGFIHRAPPQAREQAAELFRNLITWCFRGNRPLRTAMVKFIAICSGLRPDLLDNRSGSELAEELKITKQALCKQSILFSDAWKIQFARGRKKESREHMAAAAFRAHQNRNHEDQA